MRASAATADGKRRSAGQRERIDVAIDAPRLLGVAEPHALVIKRADIAKRSILVDAVHAQTHAAAFAANKPAVRKIVTHRGKAATSGVTAVKARKVAVSVRALADGQIATEADGPVWGPICHRGGLGMGRSPA